jgi:hypothetical protein
METKKGRAFVDLQKDIRIVAFEKKMLWKFLVNVHQKAVYDRRVFQTREVAILAAEEKYFDEIDFDSEVPTSEPSEFL